jgi:hypothetical protein
MPCPKLSKPRCLKMHVRHVDAHHAQVLEDSPSEAAAVAYIEGLRWAGAAILVNLGSAVR